MARNTDKYAYVEVSLRKDSWLYKLLNTDAIDGGISLADAIKARLIVACQGAPLPVSHYPRAEKQEVLSGAATSHKIKETAPTFSEDREEDPEEVMSFDLEKAFASANLFDQNGLTD